MKKLILLTAAAACATGAFARDVQLDKISADFDRLDANQDAMISASEAAETNLMTYFRGIDKNDDEMLSQGEFNSYIDQFPYIVKGSEQNS